MFLGSSLPRKHGYFDDQDIFNVDTACSVHVLDLYISGILIDVSLLIWLSARLPSIAYAVC